MPVAQPVDCAAAGEDAVALNALGRVAPTPLHPSLRKPAPADLSSSTERKVKGHWRIRTSDETVSCVERLRFSILGIHQKRAGTPQSNAARSCTLTLKICSSSTFNLCRSAQRRLQRRVRTARVIDRCVESKKISLGERHPRRLFQQGLRFFFTWKAELQLSNGSLPELPKTKNRVAAVHRG